MNILGIMEDSVRYPLSDWKKVLILGIIILFTSISGITIISALLGTTDVTITRFLDILYLLVYGYLFRVVKSSISGEIDLPEFGDWFNMFIDGLKVLMVGVVYSIPAILIIMVFAAVPFASTLGIIGSNVSTVINTLLYTAGIWSVIPILYMVLIIPVLLIAVMNMAFNDDKFSAAFRFNKIINIILTIGWKHLVGWYAATGIIYLLVFLSGSLLFGFLSILIHPIVEHVFSALIIGQILTLLILIPYLNIYVARSLALFYTSE